METETNADNQNQRAWIELRDYVQLMRDRSRAVIDKNSIGLIDFYNGSVVVCNGILKRMEDLRLEVATVQLCTPTMFTVRICMPEGERP